MSDSHVTHPSFSPFQVRLTSKSDCIGLVILGVIGLLGLRGLLRVYVSFLYQTFNFMLLFLFQMFILYT